MDVAWKREDCVDALLQVGLPLGLGVMLVRLGRVPAFASFLTIFSLMILLSLIGAALALLGTRSPVQIADPWLAAADKSLPVSAMDIVMSTQQLPAWAIWGLAKVYLQTGSGFLFSMIALHLMDRISLAWRIFLIWGWAFLAISLIAFIAPAVGCFSQFSAEQVAHLPNGAGRYAIRKFHEFRDAVQPVLAVDRISGVITFPSLHAVTALLIAQAWHGVRLMDPLSKVMAGLIIFSCVPIGGHYLVDLIAGAAVWWAVTLVIDRFGKAGQGADTEGLLPAAAA